jgi:flavin-dependent dehydrogenase
MNTAPENRHNKQPHAIVIGGSIAGLLAVCVLTKYFEQVNIIERDCYPERPKLCLVYIHGLYSSQCNF